jgi:hypothetical protein
MVLEYMTWINHRLALRKWTSFYAENCLKVNQKNKSAILLNLLAMSGIPGTTFDLEDELDSLALRFPSNDKIKLYLALTACSERKTAYIFRELISTYSKPDLLHAEYAKKLISQYHPNEV